MPAPHPKARMDGNDFYFSASLVEEWCVCVCTHACVLMDTGVACVPVCTCNVCLCVRTWAHICVGTACVCAYLCEYVYVKLMYLHVCVRVFVHMGAYACRCSVCVPM